MAEVPQVQDVCFAKIWVLANKLQVIFYLIMSFFQFVFVSKTAVMYRNRTKSLSMGWSGLWW